MGEERGGCGTILFPGPGESGVLHTAEWGMKFGACGGGVDLDKAGLELGHAAADGTLVTAYYFNEDAKTERFIGATRWRP